jgi:hypothetical protein
MIRSDALLEVLVKARTARRSAVVALLVMALFGAGAGVAPQAQAASRWASIATATIHPGSETRTPAGQCTANFVFFLGADVFVGQAAHCAGTGAATDTDGCDSGSLPLGIPVTVEGATKPGVMVYSSWLTMQANGEKDPFTCAYNDFALVRLDPADRGRVNPTIPHWGGPTGVNKSGLGVLDPVYTYGNSSLRQGIDLLKPKSGFSLGTEDGGWAHPTYTITPGIPGDSGSAMVDGRGYATGILSTLSIAPLPASNGFVDVSHVLRYAQAHGWKGLLLAKGTSPFNPAQLPLGL